MRDIRSSFIPKTGRGSWLRWREALAGGKRYDVEYRIVRPNGEVRIMHSQGDVTKDESDRPSRIFGTVEDITERKQAERALQENAQRYRYIFESTGVSI